MTKDDLSKYDHIPTSKIIEDIRDTQLEINVRQEQIDDRKEFIDNLRKILKYRE